jgi:hypothetical protein
LPGQTALTTGRHNRSADRGENFDKEGINDGGMSRWFDFRHRGFAVVALTIISRGLSLKHSFSASGSQGPRIDSFADGICPRWVK